MIKLFKVTPINIIIEKRGECRALFVQLMYMIKVNYMELKFNFEI